MRPWARAILADLNSDVMVSAASVYEIGLKVRLGKLPQAASFESDLVFNLEKVLGFKVLTLDAATMLGAARFQDKHPDPFDRMIAAQALQLGLPLLSVDGRMDTFGVRRITVASAGPAPGAGPKQKKPR